MITESQLLILKDMFEDCDDERLMCSISINCLGYRNITLEINHINDCDYKELEALQEVTGDGSGESLPEVSQEERDSDGWIVWNGGGKELTREDVQVKFRNNQTDFGKIIDWNWNHNGGEWDIIAYRK